MKKTLIFPLSGLIILGVCAFFFLDPSQEKEKVELSLPEVLFETSGFYDQEILNNKELDDFFTTLKLFIKYVSGTPIKPIS